MAAREDKPDCVRILLSHPNIDVNIKNHEGRTAMMDAKYRSLGVLNKMLHTCKDFPADSYNKVVLCGNSGAGKSTLTQVRRAIYLMARGHNCRYLDQVMATIIVSHS